MTTVDTNAMAEDTGSSPTKKKKSNKRLSVERIYQKKTQREHILIRPDAYIGSVEPETRNMWVWDNALECIVQREITFVPGLYKIFDEILVNAADNKQRDPSGMDHIKIIIDKEKNFISVWNNGRGIPIEVHKVEKVYVPSLIFGQLLTSSNYDDTEKKVTGGRNGFGAKLCNIFSKKFTVETACKEYGKKFKQTWKDNMTKTGEASITDFSGRDFTLIQFQPDLPKFHMEVLSDDMIALLKRRAYDIAGSSRGVSVTLNGEKLKIKSFRDYVDLYLKGSAKEKDEDLPKPKIVHEIINPRWEIAVTVSDMGFQQFSFVNSIATSKGGSHINYVVDQIVEKMMATVKRKTSKELSIKPFQIKNHLWIFVNCLIENPTFDSQTKENMTLRIKAFGSKCELNEKFIKQVQGCGVLDSIMNWVKFKTQEKMNKKCHTTKHSKLKGIPKLDDANDAGGKNSRNCTLILTEGDSAKTLAVSGLGVIGRDKYGVFPLRGKLLNVRDASSKQILENAEINNLVKIMGLQYKKKYASEDDLKTLRYGHIMIMTDQDQDGSHIKGLLINFIHHNWPSLLKMSFLEEFITPIVKVSKGNQELSFFSLPEFEEWKNETPHANSWKVKYYKGLGTSTSKEAKEYFSDMKKHRIVFDYNGPASDQAIEMAFSKKMVQDRKDWLTSGMEERKRRKQLGMPEIYLYEKGTERVSYSDFVNKELILFSNADNERSIPCLVDGLKPGQRKVLFTCFKRKDKREVKVAQLAGSIAELSAYHHGEVSLMGTIINLAQNYVGSNNINLLQPIGQFGTRIHGGKDSASPRYIFTMLSPLARLIYPEADDPLLNYLLDDNQRIEPEWYCPIIPMVLVNGADGIGTGYMTKIPNYDPREIAENIKRMIAGEEPEMMIPSFKNFKGSITELEPQKYQCTGTVNVLDEKTLEITELPVKTWTQNYKEQLLEPYLYGTEKIKVCITDYKEYHTDTTVHFVVSMTEENLAQAEQEGILKKFKLETSIATSSMVLFDAYGCLRKYENVIEILKDFFDIRFKKYQERKDFVEGMLQAECSKLENQARFILEKIDGQVVLENRGKRDIVTQLVQRGYQSDPVKAWKSSIAKDQLGEETQSETGSVMSGELGGPDFSYILSMHLLSLSKEKKEELLKTRDAKREELEVIRGKTPEDLWVEDLDKFLEELDNVEQQERDEVNAKGALVSKNPTKRGKQTKLVKKEPAKKPKVVKENPKKTEEKKKDKDDWGFDDDSSEASGMMSLADRLAAKKAAAPSLSSVSSVSAPTKSKQSTLKFGAAVKKTAKRKNDSDDDSFNVDLSDEEVTTKKPTKKKVARRKTDSDDDDSFDVDLSDNEGIASKKPARSRPAKKYVFSDNEDDEDNKIEDFSDDDSAYVASVNGDEQDDDDFVVPKKKPAAVAQPAATSKPKDNNIVDGFESDSENSEVEATKALIEKLSPMKKPKSSSDDDKSKSSVAATRDLLDLASSESQESNDIQILSQKSPPPKTTTKPTNRNKAEGKGKKVEKKDPKQTTLFAAVAKSADKTKETKAKKASGPSKKTVSKPEQKPKSSKGAAKRLKSDSSDEEESGVNKKKVKKSTAAVKTGKPKTAAKKKKKSADSSDEDDDFGFGSSSKSQDEVEPSALPKRATGRTKITTVKPKYVFSDSSDDEEEVAPKKSMSKGGRKAEEESWVISDDSDFD